MSLIQKNAPKGATKCYKNELNVIGVINIRETFTTQIKWYIKNVQLNTYTNICVIISAY